MATYIGEMHKLVIGDKEYSLPSSGGSGTVTSVRVQATSPVQSSTSTEQTTSLNTTISLADGYGDTKNPYGTKTANYVLAGPTSGSAAAPSFRALVAADIPSLTVSKISDFPSTMTPSSHSHGNITNGGDITATAPTIASGDQIIINDHSTSKITNGPTFDGSTTTTALTPKGTWETFLKSYTEQYTGTVTSVGLTNATNGGLTISGSPVTGSGSITVGHSNVLTSAQTTQAVYPIKIDKNGHISAYGSAVTIPSAVTETTVSGWGFTKNTGTVTSVGISNATNGGLSVSGSPVTSSGTITVGHSNVLSSAQTTQAIYPIKIYKNGHISAYGSAVSIPTKYSDLTNDGGFYLGGSANEFTVYNTITSSKVNAELQMKTTNGNSLMFDINENGNLKLQSVPVVSGADDWNNASTIFNVEMGSLGTPIDITNTFSITATSTSTVSSISVPWAYKCGNYVIFRVDFANNNGAIAIGSSATASISSIYLPTHQISSCGYRASSGLMAWISGGTLTVRVVGAQLTKSTSVASIVFQGMLNVPS